MKKRDLDKNKIELTSTEKKVEDKPINPPNTTGISQHSSPQINKNEDLEVNEINNKTI